MLKMWIFFEFYIPSQMFWTSVVYRFWVSFLCYGRFAITLSCLKEMKEVHTFILEKYRILFYPLRLGSWMTYITLEVGTQLHTRYFLKLFLFFGTGIILIWVLLCGWDFSVASLIAPGSSFSWYKKTNVDASSLQLEDA